MTRAASRTALLSLLVSLLVTVTLGCDATLGVPVTRSFADPHSTHVGGMLEARLHVPRAYDTTLGVEMAHLGQPSPTTAADQWRAGVVVGRNELLRPMGSHFSTDFSMRLGLYRGSNGDLTRLGPYTGVAFAVPIRLTCNREPWELDELIYPVFSLVPQVGANVLVHEFQPGGGAFEILGSLSLRVTIASTLMP